MKHLAVYNYVIVSVLSCFFSLPWDTGHSCLRLFCFWEHVFDIDWLYELKFAWCLWDFNHLNGTSSDIWSCGVILFVLMAGYLPFDEPSLIGLYKKVSTLQIWPVFLDENFIKIVCTLINFRSGRLLSAVHHGFHLVLGIWLSVFLIQTLLP